MQRLLLTLMAVGCMAAANAQGLKDAVGKYCLIGAAINQWQSDGQVPEADAVLDKHFNCAVAENCMKPETLAPAEGIFDFRVADKFVNYCQQHNVKAFDRTYGTDGHENRRKDIAVVGMNNTCTRPYAF